MGRIRDTLGSGREDVAAAMRAELARQPGGAEGVLHRPGAAQGAPASPGAAGATKHICSACLHASPHSGSKIAGCVAGCYMASALHSALNSLYAPTASLGMGCLLPELLVACLKSHAIMQASL
jgi:hypothetical protein